MAIDVWRTDDRALIERFLRRDRELHVYELGDLDPFFWPKTTWWAAGRGRDVTALALLYQAPSLPALLVLERTDVEAAQWLLGALTGEVRHRFYAHLSPGLAETLQARERASRGTYLKMVLRSLPEVATPCVHRLCAEDEPALRELYAEAYPGNWFDPRMLETGEYFGERDAGRLVGVAGVHVFSPEYGVAALGNITTAPSHRGRGVGRRTTAALCRSLLRKVDTVALNVAAENVPAIACYEGLGFVRCATYEEWMVEASGDESRLR